MQDEPQKLNDLLADIFSLSSDGYDSNAKAVFEYITEVEKEKAQSRDGLFLDNAGVFQKVENVDQRQAAKFISDEQIAQIFHTRFSSRLTKAELQLVKNLLVLKTLREDSEESGVSYETRRNQFKSISDKAGIKRQSELLMILSSLIATAISTPDEETHRIESQLRNFRSDFFDSNFRIHSPKLASGRPFLVADLGPIEGRPCVMMHSPFFPIFPLPHQEKVLDDLNIRVITPIRPGYFGVPHIGGNPDGRLAAYVDDLEDFINTFNLGQAPILSQSNGVITALELARRSEKKDRRFLLSSPQYPMVDSNKTLARHHKGMIALCRRSPQLFGAAFSTFGRTLISHNNFAGYYAKLYHKSLPDMALITDVQVQPWIYKYLVKTALNNMSGLVNDIVLSLDDRTVQIIENPMKVRFLYGEHDPYAFLEKVTERFKSLDLDMEVVEGFGQNSMMFHAEDLLGRVFE